MQKLSHNGKEMPKRKDANVEESDLTSQESFRKYAKLLSLECSQIEQKQQGRMKRVSERIERGKLLQKHLQNAQGLLETTSLTQRNLRDSTQKLLQDVHTFLAAPDV